MSLRMVVLVAGPPGAGKSTRARELARQHGLDVLDLDDDGWTQASWDAALLVVRCEPAARAVVIRSCSTAAAYAIACRAIDPTVVELLDVDELECRRRIVGDARIDAQRAKRLAGVRSWWSAYRADPWKPPALTPSRSW